MKLEVLLSCMHQTDDRLVRKSGLTGNVLIINQCHMESYSEYQTEKGIARMISVTERGLSKSRNLAIEKAMADICLLCDDDEEFVPDYETKILDTFDKIPTADVVIFKICNRPKSFPDKTQRLRFPQTMRVSSWQIAFRRERLVQAGVRFDELLGAGTGNGAEEELKFLIDCEKRGLSIFYAPVAIASVAQQQSTWFDGFTVAFFENRGASTRYILGPLPAAAYAVYYAVRKRKMYREQISVKDALAAMFRGILHNKIGKQAKSIDNGGVTLP